MKGKDPVKAKMKRRLQVPESSAPCADRQRRTDRQACVDEIGRGVHVWIGVLTSIIMIMRDKHHDIIIRRDGLMRGGDG